MYAPGRSLTQPTLAPRAVRHNALNPRRAPVLLLSRTFSRLLSSAHRRACALRVRAQLSDGDFMPGHLFGKGGGDDPDTWFHNDHNGHLCYACVAHEYVVLVGVKVSSC